jgi:hypothetical protein
MKVTHCTHSCAEWRPTDQVDVNALKSNGYDFVHERPEARDTRQRKVGEWCEAAFGTEHATSLPQRGVRLLEEAIEAYQAAGGDLAMGHKLLDFVFARPVGQLGQELGGIGITLLALAQAAGLSADGEEAREFDRVLAKPLSHFTARNEAKNAAGFNVATQEHST